MNPFLTAAETGQEALPSASTASVTEVINLIKTSVTGVFEIGTSAMSYLLSNPLFAFMVGSGFAFSAIGLVRKTLRTARRA